MLFERIRRTQKPVFIFLAVTFGLGFALLGVGSGSGTINFGNIFGSSSSSNSISSLNDAVHKNPNDAPSWLKLAQAYTTAGQNDPAIGAYETYTGLRPKDTGALASVSTLLEQRAQIESQNGSAYQSAASYYTGSGGPFSGLRLGSALTDPLGGQVGSTYQQQASTYEQAATGDYTQALGYRQKLATLDSSNAINQLLLGNDAANTRSYAVAVTAFEAFLAKAPASPQAAQVRQLLKVLKPLAKTTPATPTPTTPTATGSTTGH